MEWPGSDLIPIRYSERNAVGIQSYIYEVPRVPLENSWIASKGRSLTFKEEHSIKEHSETLSQVFSSFL